MWYKNHMETCETHEVHPSTTHLYVKLDVLTGHIVKDGIFVSSKILRLIHTLIYYGQSTDRCLRGWIFVGRGTGS